MIPWLTQTSAELEPTAVRQFFREGCDLVEIRLGQIDRDLKGVKFHFGEPRLLEKGGHRGIGTEMQRQALRKRPGLLHDRQILFPRMKEVKADENTPGCEGFENTPASPLEALVVHTENHGAAGNGIVGPPAQGLNIRGLKTDAMERRIPSAMLDLFRIKVYPVQIRIGKGGAHHPQQISSGTTDVHDSRFLLPEAGLQVLDQDFVAFSRLGFVPLLVGDVFAHVTGVRRIIIGQLLDGFHREESVGIGRFIGSLIFTTEFSKWEHSPMNT